MRADWLRVEQPPFESCWRRLQEKAAEQGWPLPSKKTVERKLLALPLTVRVLAREGMEALKRRYPAQKRDRSMFHALQAVNVDGHKWDVWVKWPDGSISRPMMVAFQDLYSNKVLAWRIDRSENSEAVRLAIGDMVSTYGVPDICVLDNGKAFASKWITGGTPNRYRFKVKDEDPAGLLTTLGVEIHWTTPYSGQSKPIERAFRDMCSDIAKDPRLAGAWTGNTVANKPENYGSKSIPIDKFIAVVAEGIALHNARQGRRTDVAQGRSFDQVFQESYRVSPIRRASDEQRRLWLLAVEGIRSRRDGSIELQGNRYWTEQLVDFAQHKLIVRFDPQALHTEIHAYRLDGSYICSAPVIEAAGFADVEKARQHAQSRNKWLRAQKDMLEAERVIGIDQVAALMPKAEQTPAPETKVVRPIFGTQGSAALAARPIDDFDEQQDRAGASLGKFLRLVQGAHENGADGD
jgi:transposase InsO family protein